MKRKRITITHNGFHGINEVSFLVPADAEPGDEVEVSPAVARRLNNEVCGIQGCRCGEYIAHEISPDIWVDDRWAVRLPKNGKMRGKHPQD